MTTNVAAAHASRSHGAKVASSTPTADQLAIQVNDDKLTLAVARAPQVYMYGPMDADAPHRVEALIRSWKIPRGSDVYLNSPGGDLDAGIALGKLFRANGMVTHLGTPRRVTQRTRSISRDALCMDACTLAYFGGLYRWAPAGRDRLGWHTLSTNPKAGAQQALAVSSYLKDMGIRAETLAPQAGSRDGVVWLDADAMMASGAANNGHLPITATYQLSAGAPSLTLNQMVRNGVNRMVITCKPEGLALTSYYIVGSDRARQIVTGAARSFLEIDKQETLPQRSGGVTKLNEAVVIDRVYPVNQTARLFSARSMGAWVVGWSSPLRYGFTLWLAPVRHNVDDFSARCGQAIQQHGRR
ncbi:hypothetical protein [Rhodanobacter sp. L36]|uniref:hypothetical protein n=1 Tax=Rhodanobacter sp. L36 TaxID=1747221 RepID=UPI00131D1431|nr:hypothetical protein [Rhodanobacter sp. L36]